ncbi:MAG: acetylornithine deacetylase [Rhodobacteraceae bacterium]|nr:acetylornithine deacetylase [Paracoccaceae bacterium]
MDRLEETIAVLDRLIAFPTVSCDSNSECIDWIAEYLGRLGAKCTLTSDTPGKANLFATLGPDVAGGVILSGHTDVVPVVGQNWASDPFQLRRENGILYGRGTCDMKGFIAAALVTAKYCARQGLHRPLHLAFTYDEEIGCLGARVLVDEMIKSGVQPAACIIGEPTSMGIIEAHKGCCEYSYEFKGLEGHSSLPDLGVNALEYASRYVARLMELRAALPDRAPEGCRFDPPHSTLQITGLRSGIAHNVIPALAQVDWEMRPVQESDRAYIRAAIAEYVTTVLRPQMQAANSACDITEVFASEVDGLEPDPGSEAIRIVRFLTGANETGVVSFGTEAGLFQKAGISSVICGPGSIEQAHKPDEFVSEEQLNTCLKMLAKLGETLT